MKVYTLNEERQWDDQGTGHVSSAYVDRLNGIALLVRAEADGKAHESSSVLSSARAQARLSCASSENC